MSLYTPIIRTQYSNIYSPILPTAPPPPPPPPPQSNQPLSKLGRPKLVSQIILSQEVPDAEYLPRPTLEKSINSEAFYEERLERYSDQFDSNLALIYLSFVKPTLSNTISVPPKFRFPKVSKGSGGYADQYRMFGFYVKDIYTSRRLYHIWQVDESECNFKKLQTAVRRKCRHSGIDYRKMRDEHKMARERAEQNRVKRESSPESDEARPAPPKCRCGLKRSIQCSNEMCLHHCLEKGNCEFHSRHLRAKTIRVGGNPASTTRPKYRVSRRNRWTHRKRRHLDDDRQKRTTKKAKTSKTSSRQPTRGQSLAKNRRGPSDMVKRFRLPKNSRGSGGLGSLTSLSNAALQQEPSDDTREHTKTKNLQMVHTCSIPWCQHEFESARDLNMHYKQHDAAKESEKSEEYEDSERSKIVEISDEPHDSEDSDDSDSSVKKNGIQHPERTAGGTAVPEVADGSTSDLSDESEVSDETEESEGKIEFGESSDENFEGNSEVVIVSSESEGSAVRSKRSKPKRGRMKVDTATRGWCTHGFHWVSVLKCRSRPHVAQATLHSCPRHALGPYPFNKRAYARIGKHARQCRLGDGHVCVISEEDKMKNESLFSSGHGADKKISNSSARYPYGCSQCNRSFATKSQRHIHTRTAHFKCILPHCFRKFNAGNRKAFDEHIRQHIGVNANWNSSAENHRCTTCDSTFTSFTNLAAHYDYSECTAQVGENHMSLVGKLRLEEREIFECDEQIKVLEEQLSQIHAKKLLHSRRVGDYRKMLKTDPNSARVYRNRNGSLSSDGDGKASQGKTKDARNDVTGAKSVAGLPGAVSQNSVDERERATIRTKIPRNMCQVDPLLDD